MRVNCWEAKKCRRQPGGENSGQFGICPASIETKAHGIDGGIHGGRACWVIENTLCNNEVQGIFTEKLNSCMQCDFYASVRNEDKEQYMGTKDILPTLKRHSDQVTASMPISFEAYY